MKQHMPFLIQVYASGQEKRKRKRKKKEKEKERTTILIVALGNLK